METTLLATTTAPEEIKDVPVTEVVELSLSDLDCIGGGTLLGAFN